nr:hypothetical protein [uncultured Enterobacter sp.]
MFIAWYWLVLIAALAIGYVLHMRRYCAAFRQDRDAMLEGYRRLRQKLKKSPAESEARPRQAEEKTPEEQA